jgi:hypothetical protein
VARRPLSGGIAGGTEVLTLRDGREFVWKPASGENAGAMLANEAGVAAGDRYRRAAASSQIANSMGIQTPHTEVVVLDGQVGQLQAFEGGEGLHNLGEMSVDPAHPAAGAADQVYESQQRLDIDAFDFVTGQMDRHRGNFMVDMDPRTGALRRLLPIDNDSSLPATPGRYSGPGGAGRMIGRHPITAFQRPIPPTISRGLATRMRALVANPEPLRNALGENLTPAEINAMLLRLSEVVNAIDSGATQVVH